MNLATCLHYIVLLISKCFLYSQLYHYLQSVEESEEESEEASLMTIEDVTENIVGLTDICFICWHLLYLISVIRSTVFFVYNTVA